MAGSATPALLALRAAGVAHRVHRYELGATGRSADGHRAYGLEASAALRVPPGRVFKTLVVVVDARPMIAIVPVAAELDLKLLADAVGGRRATMAEPSAAERATGYVIGGISPLGGRRRLPTVLDVSALDHGTVFVSAGRRGLQIELPPADLASLTDARIAPIARLVPIAH